MSMISSSQPNPAPTSPLLQEAEACEALMVEAPLHWTKSVMKIGSMTGALNALREHAGLSTSELQKLTIDTLRDCSIYITVKDSKIEKIFIQTFRKQFIKPLEGFLQYESMIPTVADITRWQKFGYKAQVTVPSTGFSEVASKMRDTITKIQTFMERFKCTLDSQDGVIQKLIDALARSWNHVHLESSKGTDPASLIEFMRNLATPASASAGAGSASSVSSSSTTSSSGSSGPQKDAKDTKSSSKTGSKSGATSGSAQQTQFPSSGSVSANGQGNCAPSASSTSATSSSLRVSWEQWAHGAIPGGLHPVDLRVIAQPGDVGVQSRAFAAFSASSSASK